MVGKPTHKELEQRIRELEQRISSFGQQEDFLNSSKKELGTLFEKAPLVMFVLDRERRVCKLNEAAVAMTRRLEKESIGLRSGEALRCINAFDDLKGCGFSAACKSCVVRNTVMETFRSCQDRRSVEAPIPYTAKNGAVDMWVLVSTTFMKLSEGSRVLVCLEDITERKRVQDALAESEERLQALSDASFEAIFLSDKGICLDQNSTAEKMFGFSLQEAVGLNGTEWIIPEDREKVKNNMVSGHEKPYEVTALRKDGTTFPAEIQARMINYRGRNVRVTALRNIIERKQARKELRESETKYKSLANNLNVGVYRNSVGSRGKFIEANLAIVKMFGLDSREEFLKVCVSDLYKNPNDLKKFTVRLLKSGAVNNEELELQKLDGSSFIGSVSAVVVRDEKDEVKYFDGIIEDITDRKRVESALIASDEKYRTVLEANPDPVVVYDMQGKVVYFNPAFTDVFGWTLEERLGKKNNDFVPEEAWRETKMMIDKVLSGEQFSGIKTCRYNNKREIIPTSISGAIYKDPNGNPIGSVICLRDVSNQKKIEAQLQQAQKMEAIGTLAGGIAHDFNNILSAILGYSELALAELPPEASLKNKLEAIHSSGMRARDLVSQILAFSRKDDQVRSIVELHLIVQDALKLLRPAIPTTIDIQTQITSKCQILGDPSRIHQVIMNLCTNAFQAMLEAGGTLTISLSHVKMEGKELALTRLPVGVYGKLIISDTGIGIPTENIKRIFDPYFTTKEKGKGTGLGLAAVHGIVKSHGGAILVESQIGKGTAFEVYLPLTKDRNDKRKKPESQILGGKERVLLIDDEQDILEIEKEMLEKLGYNIKAVDNAQEALKLFAGQPDQFDLVITDMTMPHMTGDKLAGELRKIHPDIPIILCTGFSELISGDKAGTLGIKGFLMKPIGMKDLSRMIRNVLDKKAN